MSRFILRNARLRAPDRREGLWRIAATDGIIASITPEGSPSNDAVSGDDTREIDAEGRLVTESFVNGHLHLDKVYTLSLLGDSALSEYHGKGMGGAMTAIERAAAVKEHYDESALMAGIQQAAELAISYGTTTILAFADTDTRAKLKGVRAVMRVRDMLSDRIDIRVVAFPQDGVLRDPGAASLVEEAIAEGADVVGGIPWIEYTEEDARHHVDSMLDLAVKYGRGISMLVDDAGDPGLRTLEYLAAGVIKRGIRSTVTAQHARAMALYLEPYLRKVFVLLKQSGIGIVSDPHTGPLHAPIRQLLAEGIPVALGQDDISDAYYPFGRNNMLEVAFLASHLLWMTTGDEQELLYDMVTTRAADVLGIAGHRLVEGGNADMVVLNAENVLDALRNHDRPRYVIRKGTVATEGP